MNCAEFQEFLPELLEGSRNVEHEAHLKTCLACTELFADLEAISRSARQLRDNEEPSPRVWNSIEIVLREEGLIYQPQRDPAPIAAFPSSRRWGLGWLVPVAAALLVGFGLWTYQHGSPSSPMQPLSSASVTSTNGLQTASISLEDKQLLDVVAARMPTLRATYETDLQDVNAYIQDAQQSVHSNPNDEEAQESLMQAYEQRAMLYEMALNRSLP